ncbi:3-hydroxy-3-methylglutaryl-coenzyme A reductase [Fusarium oxysporum f. sp. albedinis]|nr:3-hydroxy-3-methylglutaryl-coenzyme A reductase [Fusarium oxysporum f. sp. albedinis]
MGGEGDFAKEDLGSLSQLDPAKLELLCGGLITVLRGQFSVIRLSKLSSPMVGPYPARISSAEPQSV